MDGYRSTTDAAVAHLQDILRENDDLRRKVQELEAERGPALPRQPTRRSTRVVAALLIGAAFGGAWVHALEQSYVAHHSPWTRGGSPCPYASRYAYHAHSPCPYAAAAAFSSAPHGEPQGAVPTAAPDAD
jgi:hypothetical protein